MKWNAYLDIKSTDILKKKLGVNERGEVQKYVDQECVTQMAPYTPFLNGDLEKSATLGTVIGSGTIQQKSPGARYLYYGKLMVSSVTGSSYASQGEKKVLTDKDLQYSTANHPKAGKKWFERMKTDKKNDILKGAQEVANRGKR